MLFVKWFVIWDIICYAVHILLGDTWFEIDEWVNEMIQNFENGDKDIDKKRRKENREREKRM